jgi:hypothetical protein
MSLELLNTFATCGTFVVIAATAIVAIVQLRHARGSNVIVALNELRESYETAKLQEAQHFVFTELTERMKDPASRQQLSDRGARTVESQASISKVIALGNYYENMGTLAKAGLIDQKLVLEVWYNDVADDWDKLTQVAAIFRRRPGISVWNSFEYLAVLSQDWRAAHPHGMYPAGVRRIDLRDDWLEADARYAASLTP